MFKGLEMIRAYWSVLVQGFSKIPHAPLDTGFLLSHDVPVWCIPGQYFPWSSPRSHGCPRGTFEDFKSILVVKKRLFRSRLVFGTRHPCSHKLSPRSHVDVATTYNNMGTEKALFHYQHEKALFHYQHALEIFKKSLENCNGWAPPRDFISMSSDFWNRTRAFWKFPRLAPRSPYCYKFQPRSHVSVAT